MACHITVPSRQPERGLEVAADLLLSCAWEGYALVDDLDAGIAAGGEGGVVDIDLDEDRVLGIRALRPAHEIVGEVGRRPGIARVGLEVYDINPSSRSADS